MTILVDLDDTVWDLCGPWCTYLNNRYNRQVCYSDIEEWDMSVAYPDLTKEQIFYPLTKEDFWMYIVPFYDCIKYLHLLQNEGNQIIFVTNTHYKNIKVKTNIIEQYFYFIPKDNFVVTSHKEFVRGDVLVDDYIENLKNRDHPILFDRPHNRNIDVNEFNAVRMENWKDIYNYIHSIS